MDGHQIHAINMTYHDGAADSYDAKWAIGYGDTAQQQVLTKMRKALGSEHPFHYESALEIGAGTGYFSLNLLQTGTIGKATCTDISPGMIDALNANAEQLGFGVETAVCDAERLPFADASFDLVLGHAILHHIPDLDRALAEFARVLKPGGAIVFAGEPSRSGDKLAAVPKRVASLLAPAWRRLLKAEPAEPGHQDGGAHNHHLEPHVDVHSFTPTDLRAAATAAGFYDVRVGGEELLANWFGWFNRTLEASADPDTVPLRFKRFAYRGYLGLQKIDAPLERALPPAVFYNLLLSARRPS
jgi:ubiquinone/menaquinone biosynthesis C-methylase UbiE